MLRFQLTRSRPRAGAARAKTSGWRVERERLRHAGKLLERAGGALSPAGRRDGGRGARRPARGRSAWSARRPRSTRALAPLPSASTALTAELDDLSAALRAYHRRPSTSTRPQSDAIELRHDKLKALMRKYGGSADEVLALCRAGPARWRASKTSTRTKSLGRPRAGAASAGAGGGRRLIRRARSQPGARRGRVASSTSCAASPCRTPRSSSRWHRAATGGRLSEPRGADDAEFLFSANPGVPPRPLRETASGGELSRAMLAIREHGHSRRRC